MSEPEIAPIDDATLDKWTERAQADGWLASRHALRLIEQVRRLQARKCPPLRGA